MVARDMERPGRRWATGPCLERARVSRRSAGSSCERRRRRPGAAPERHPPGRRGGRGLAVGRLLVGGPERDLLDRDGRDDRDDRTEHAEVEGLGGREAERPVDALDHLGDHRRDERLELRGHRGEDRRAHVADAGQRAEVEVAAGASPGRSPR